MPAPCPTQARLQARPPEDQRRRVLPRGRVRHRGRRARTTSPAVRRRRARWACSWRSSSAAGTSSAARPSPRTATSPAPPPTTWACSRPCSTPSRCRRRWRTIGQPTRVHVGDQRLQRLRAVHPPPGDPAPGEGPGDHPRRRHGQPVLHHRHLRRPARHRDPGRRAAQGHQGRRHLLRRPEEGQDRQALPRRSPTSRSTATSCR